MWGVHAQSRAATSSSLPASRPSSAFHDGVPDRQHRATIVAGDPSRLALVTRVPNLRRSFV
jgi:hypothetical protein